MGCSSVTPGQEPAAGDWTTLPVDFADEYFFLPLAVEGQEDRVLWFLYDTGASITVVDPDSLEEASAWVPSMGEDVRFGHLTCGALSLRDLSANVHQLDHLQHAVNHQLDGILGYRALAELLVEMDYLDGKMRVARGVLPPPDGEEVFQLYGDHRPYLDARIEGRNHRILVDTGSGMGFELFPRPGWDWAAEPRTVGSSMGFDGLHRYQAGRLAHPIPFLGKTYRQPLVRLADGTELVGTEVLRDYRLTFDPSHRRLRIETPLGQEVEPQRFLGTGAIFRPEAKGLIVIEVLPGSPAEQAGIRVGDEVQRVALAPGVHRRMQVEGQTYRLRRGHRHMHVEIPYADLVPMAEPSP